MTDVMVELRGANPAPAGAEPHATAWSDTALLAEIDTRSGTDMSLDQKPKTERASAVGEPRRWKPTWVAATAFAAVVAVIGVVALLDLGESDTTPPATTGTIAPTTTNAPPSTTSEVTAPPTLTQDDLGLSSDQLTFVQEFVDTWNNDVDAYLALFAPNARIETIRSAKYDIMVDDRTPIQRDKFEAMSRWDAAVQTQTTVNVERCVQRSGTISCPFSMTDILIEGTIRAATGVLELIVNEGQIQHIGFAWSSEFGYGGVALEFEAWMAKNHPDKAEGAGMYELYTLESADIWLEYVPLYLDNRFNS